MLLRATLAAAAAAAVAAAAAAPPASPGAPLPPVAIAIDPTAADDAAAVLAIVLPELHAELAALHPAPPGAPAARPTVTFDLAPGWRAAHRTPAGERHTRTLLPPATPAGGLSVTVTAGGLLGLAYAVHDLREHLALWPGARAGGSSSGAGAPPPPAGWAADALAAFGSAAPPTPLYATRAWSEEGQLLALPDRGYYTQPDGGAANVTAIAGEAAALEGEVVPALLRLRMNALVVLHSDVEDYVTYDSLPGFLPGAPAVYAPGDAHRVRRSGVLSVMAPWIAHLAADFGLGFYFQVYELSSPPGVCVPPAGGGKPLLNCSLGSPAVPALLKVRPRAGGY